MIKRFIKNGLMAFSAAIHRNRKSKIFYYHDVFGSKKYTTMGTPLPLFKEHIKLLGQNGFSIVETISRPEDEVMICFDDGFHGIYDVKDFFFESGISPTVFLAVSLIGQPGYLTESEILELQSSGFRFESHAWSHSDLTAFSPEDLEREIGQSKAWLEHLLGKTVDEICFPIGYFSQRVIEGCRRHGYRKMYSSIPGNYDDNLGWPGLLPRNLVQHASARQVLTIAHGGNQILTSHYRNLHIKE